MKPVFTARFGFFGGIRGGTSSTTAVVLPPRLSVPALSLGGLGQPFDGCSTSFPTSEIHCQMAFAAAGSSILLGFSERYRLSWSSAFPVRPPDSDPSLTTRPPRTKVCKLSLCVWPAKTSALSVHFLCRRHYVFVAASTAYRNAHPIATGTATCRYVNPCSPLLDHCNEV